MSFLRISSSEPPASAAEFAITKPARPLPFRAELNAWDPDVVGVVGLGQPEREAAVSFEFGFVDLVHVERRIGPHIIEMAHRLVGILVEGIGLAALALQPSD